MSLRTQILSAAKIYVNICIVEMNKGHLDYKLLTSKSSRDWHSTENLQKSSSFILLIFKKVYLLPRYQSIFFIQDILTRITTLDPKYWDHISWFTQNSLIHLLYSVIIKRNSSIQKYSGLDSNVHNHLILQCGKSFQIIPHHD